MSALLDAMLAETPWGLWPLTESSGSVAHNAVGGGADGTYGSSITLAAATLPNGETVCKPDDDSTSNQNVTFLDSAITSIPSGDSHYTVACVFLAPNVGHAQGFVAWGTVSDNEYLGLLIDESAVVQQRWLSSDLTSTAGVDESVVWTDGGGTRANFLVATYDGTTRITYLNGSELSRDVPGAAHALTAAGLSFGTTDNHTDFPVTGGLGYVGIYSHAVTPAVVASWYLALHPTLVDLDTFLTPLGGVVFPLQDVTGRDTLKSLDGTRTLTIQNSGVDTSTADGPKASLKSWQFNGAGYASVDSSTGLPTGSSHYTLFAMLNSNYDGESGIVSYGNTSSNAGNNFEESNAGALENDWYGNGFGAATPLPMNVDRWHIAAATFDGTHRTIWQDNHAADQDAPSGGAHVSSNLEVGRYAQSDDTFAHGRMAYVGVLPVALSYTQMSHLAAFMLADPPAGVGVGPTISGIATTRTRGLGAIYVFGAPPRTMTFPLRYLNGSGRPMVGAVWQGQVSGIAEGQALRHINGDILEPFSDPATTDASGLALLTVIPPGDMVPENTTWLFTVTGGTPGE